MTVPLGLDSDLTQMSTEVTARQEPLREYRIAFWLNEKAEETVKRWDFIHCH